MIINKITTEEQYEQYLQRMKVVFDAKKNTPEYLELDKLADCIEEFENIHYQIL